MRSRKCESRQVQFQGVFWKNCKKALQIYRKFEISYFSQSCNWKKNFRKLRTCQQVQLSQTQMCLQVQHKLPNSLCWEYNGKFNAHLQKELVLYILQGELITSYNFLINSLCTCYGIALPVGSLQYAKLLSNLPDPFVAKMFITVL